MVLAILLGSLLTGAAFGAAAWARGGPDTAARRLPGLHFAKWTLGLFLAAAVGLLLVLMQLAAGCAIAGLGPDEDRPALDGAVCGWASQDAVGRWYAVVTDWQSGIGALIGLLGLAWSTILKALMDERTTSRHRKGP